MQKRKRSSSMSNIEDMALWRLSVTGTGRARMRTCRAVADSRKLLLRILGKTREEALQLDASPLDARTDSHDPCTYTHDTCTHPLDASTHHSADSS